VRRDPAPSGQNDPMSRQQNDGGGDVARGAGYAAFLGAALIGIAVIVGIVLLQVGDRNDNGPASASQPNPTTTTMPPVTTTTQKTQTSNTTALRAPSAVSLIVLNGGAASGKAGDKSQALKVKGYTNQGVPTDWSGHSQTGDSVYCRKGLDREGTALAVAVGSNTALHIGFPSPAPTASAGHDCFVVVGAPKG
jgi:hypothetical protein